MNATDTASRGQATAERGCEQSPAHEDGMRPGAGDGRATMLALGACYELARNHGTHTDRVAVEHLAADYGLTPLDLVRIPRAELHPLEAS